MNTSSPPALGISAAIVGLGSMGMRHAEAAKRLGMNIRGIADVSASTLETAGRTLDVPISGQFRDGIAMLEAVQPQAVIVATTAPSHAPLVLKAAAIGARYVLCEKPMASSLAEADEMIRACKEAGTQLAINHQMRFMPAYTRVKALIGSDELGPLVSMIVAGSNFGLAMNGSHYFEAFRYLTGKPIISVQAWLDRDELANPRGIEFDDRSGRLIAKDDSDTTLFLDFSAKAGWGLQVIYICRYGQIVTDQLNGELRVASRREEFRDLPTSRYGLPADIWTELVPPAETVECTMAVWGAMLSGLPFPDGAIGMHSMACLVAAHASHRASGKAVSTDMPDAARTERFNWA